MKRTPSLIAVALLVVGITSCGGDAAGPPGGGGGGGGGGGTCTTATFCMTISNSFSPGTATVPAGTVVSWDNVSGTQHDVIWDTPSGRSAALAGDAAGDIPQPAAGTHTRKFNTPGSYGFHCDIHVGMTGILTVN
jgi:plastocyanin